MEVKMKCSRRVALIALLISQALVLSIVESWIPMPVPVPGVKLGLANIVTLIAIIFLGYREALLVVVLRCVLSSAFTGGPMVLLFSLSGGLLSTLVMSFLYGKMQKVLSITGVSMAGAVFHNIGQVAAAAFVMREPSVFAYLPVLLVSGIVAGFLIGLCGSLLARALGKAGMFSN